MASCSKDTSSSLWTTSQKQKSTKKKKSKKRHREKEEEKYCREHRKKSGKKSALPLSDAPSLQGENFKVSHKLDRSSTGIPPIQTQDPGADLKKSSKTKKCSSQHANPDRAKPKKRVVFDLSQNGSVVKEYSEGPRVCSQIACNRVGHQCIKPEPEESPDGIDSQELFITQNKFLSPSLFQDSDEDVSQTPDLSLTAFQQPPASAVSTADAANQTENFFTPRLAGFLSFKRRTLTKCAEQPVDLSLPHRQRDQQVGGDEREETDVGHQGTGKLDLSQGKVVQTRLNESFFFKLKGKKDSPKALCPLKKIKKDCGKKQKK